MNLRFPIVVAPTLLAIACALATCGTSAFAAPNFDADVQPYLTKHCASCHNAKKQEGDFRIDSLSKEVGLKDTPQWAEVMERISSGEMPPEDVPNRPSADEGAAIVEWLSARIGEGEAARMARQERVSFHRLSREEYVNSIYDLLGVHYDAGDPGGFTDDPEWHGFERIGAKLSLSAGHVEKYFIAAETILTEAYPERAYSTKQPTEVRSIDMHRPAADPETVREPYKSDLAARGLLDKIRYEMWPQDKFRYASPGRIDAPGVYECRIQLSGVLTDDEDRPLYPILILDWVEWKGPIVTAEERQRRNDYMPPRHVDDDFAGVRASLTKMATRAFRRPLRDGEIDTYVATVERELAAGPPYKAAVKAGMPAILCSKSFLFLAEDSDDVERHQLNDWELASRLSYFLWSTMPDEELFRSAEQGKLRDKKVLSSQVARMLADPKARRFATSFPKQWLQLRKVGMFPPDKELYPEYDRHLEQSMVNETTAYFAEVLNEKLSLREFLDSDWTMVNPRLAKYYDLPETEKDEFQRVQLRPGDHRGGLLTHAATLSLSSDGTRHRPVHRGAWLSEAIFGKTPPPPPANVDPIEPNPVDSPKATLRMKLEAHKHDKSCASCHRKIDPLGLAFDNYDAIGRWRTHEVTKEGMGSNPRVDASGELPDGRKFADADQFKKLLSADVDAFNTAFVRKLATYGLRRAMTFEDHEDLQAIAAVGKKADYEVRAIVEALVVSDLFQKR